MISDRDILKWLALQKCKGIGIKTAHKLINRYGDVATLFSQPFDGLVKDGLSAAIAGALLDTSLMALAESELQYARSKGLKIISYKCADYPYYLKQCGDAPLVLFQNGNFDATNHRILSVVGTRKMTSYGARMCREIIKSLAPYNPLIISGFATGVDITAHLAALDFGLETVAIFAHGFKHVFPKHHKPYISKILEKGAFLTEYWSDIIPFSANFLVRNRIVAGISQGTLVVETPLKGGSQSTLTLANDYNRETFAMPAKITDLQSEGCHGLIKSHKASLVTCAEDIAKALHWEKKSVKITTIQKQTSLDLPDSQRKIVKLLQEQKKEHLDILALQLEWPVYKLLPILLELEMKDIVTPLPGKYYTLH